MAYYLSVENKLLVEQIANRLKGTNDDVRYECRRPESLERILRSACRLSEFLWIKEKFIIKVRRGVLLFIIRDLETREILEPIDEISNLDFFGILDILTGKPKGIRFIGSSLDNTEVSSVEEWCKENKYSFSYNKETNILEVRKDG